MPDRNPRVLVTGATRGIGLACAELLAGRGYDVVGLARTLPDGEFPGTCLAVDLADRRALSDVLAGLSTGPDFHGVINNAGLVRPENLESLDPDSIDAVLQVNFVAAAQIVQALAPGMRRRRMGRIVNISTELVLGFPTRTAYGGAKAALASATRTWALELGPDGITCNAIAPGPVETALFLENNPPGSAVRAGKLAKIPVGRFGTPADIARVAAFLIEPESGYITGQTWFVDGGSSLGAGALF